MTSKQKVFAELSNLPIIDIHTHIDTAHLSARGLHDILLYHMVISDLYHAGCPSGARLTEEPSEDEIEDRIEEALPYLPYIRNTSSFWGVCLILKSLYGWVRPITTDNWRDLHGLIQKKSADPSWPRLIMQRAAIAKACTELWRGRNGVADDIFQFSLEWAFFTRSQWGQYDTALLELENVWNQDEPGAPLPVTVDIASLNLKKRIKTLHDVKEAMKHYCKKIPYNRIISVASHLSTDITYGTVSDAEMANALANRQQAGEKERDVYSNYLFELFLTEFEKMKSPIVLQFSIGAEPLPYETGSKLKADTVSQLAMILHRHPEVEFQIYLASEHQNQALCTLTREFPNLSLAGYWWHNFFPSIIRKVIGERLDMVAANKQIGFFSDAYCMDWSYAKAIIVRKQLAEVLAGKIEQEQYTMEQALTIARQILYETPKNLLRINPGETINNNPLKSFQYTSQPSDGKLTHHV